MRLCLRCVPLAPTHCSQPIPQPTVPAGSVQLFGGTNSFLLHSYVDADRLEILNAMQAAGFKVIRIFILPLWAGEKGGNSLAVRDVEGPVGSYNDDQLNMIDKLMKDASDRKMKLIITMHDRYSLGCWCVAARRKGLGREVLGSPAARRRRPHEVLGCKAAAGVCVGRLPSPQSPRPPAGGRTHTWPSMACGTPNPHVPHRMTFRRSTRALPRRPT